MIHQDHHVIYNECVRAFKLSSSIWGMEHPWNNISFRTSILVELKENHIRKKISSLRNYDSQSFREYFKEEHILACALLRGMEIGKKYVERFESIRIKFNI